MVTRPITTVAAAGLLVGSLACSGLEEAPPDLSRPNRFDEAGVSFGYPGNWTASTETEEAGEIDILTVFVESPGEAVAIVQIYPPGGRPSLDVALEVMLDSVMAAQEASSVPLTVSEPVLGRESRTVAGAEREVAVARYTISALTADVPHQLRIYDVGDVFVMTTVADEDAAVAGRGFSQILDTLALSPR